jgi:hypothetical protein
MGKNRSSETNKQKGASKKEKMMNWEVIIGIAALIGCGFILLPLLVYLLSKCIMFGILTAKQQFKEYKNGEN